jgi:drug/metabolite transporter (DMT)-like permease
MPVGQVQSSERPAQNRALAVLLLLAGFFLLTMVDATSKVLTERYHALEIGFGRAVFQILPLLIFMAWRGAAVARSAHPRLQILRGACIYFCTVMFVQGLSLLDLADCTALAYVSPCMVVLFSIWLLKEKVDWQRWVAVAIGFLGVLVVLRPGMGVFGPAALWPLSEAVLWAFALVITRMMPRDGAITTLIWTSAVQLALAAAFVPLVWSMPDIGDLPAFAAAGLLNLCGQMLLVAAFQRAPASMLAPFSTIQIIFAAIVGWLVFQTFPDFWTWVGTGAILAGGLLVWWRETRLAR